MDNNIIKIDEEGLKNDLKGVIRKTIEETLNTMLDEEAAELCHAEKHERTEGRQNYRSGHYQRRLCKFLSVKSIIHEKGPSMAYKQKVEFPLPIFGFATN